MTQKRPLAAFFRTGLSQNQRARVSWLTKILDIKETKPQSYLRHANALAVIVPWACGSATPSRPWRVQSHAMRVAPLGKAVERRGLGRIVDRSEQSRVEIAGRTFELGEGA